ncbi:MAG: YabP/YqfC family sporulation protein [Desulfitobacteriia bacterium]
MFKKLQKQAGEILEFPSDILGQGPKITIIGRSEMIVEHYKEVIHFGAEEIILSTAEGNVVIKGRELVILTVLPTEINLKGRLLQVSFEEG